MSDKPIIVYAVMAVLLITGIAVGPALKPSAEQVPVVPARDEQLETIQERLDSQEELLHQLQGIVSQFDEQLASYRLYTSEIAKSLVDLNKQLRESQAECERLERENMRLERRAMGLVEGDE